jgi:hypothetical protein
MKAFSMGMWVLLPGKPVAVSAMVANAFSWWLRPVSMHDRVGPHRAVVCHCEYMRPLSASRCRVGISMRPPNGDQAASPVSSYSTTSTLGAPAGAFSAT